MLLLDHVKIERSLLTVNLMISYPETVGPWSGHGEDGQSVEVGSLVTRKSSWRQDGGGEVWATTLTSLCLRGLCRLSCDNHHQHHSPKQAAT